MELLEPHIRSGLGIAIKADNGKYLTREGPVGLVFKKSVKDPYTVFDIEKVDDNTISLKNRSNGYYVCRTDLDLTKVWRSKENFSLDAKKSRAEPYCYFTPFESDGKIVFKNAGRFVSRVFLSSCGEDQIWSSKEGTVHSGRL